MAAVTSGGAASATARDCAVAPGCSSTLVTPAVASTCAAATRRSAGSGAPTTSSRITSLPDRPAVVPATTSLSRACASSTVDGASGCARLGDSTFQLGLARSAPVVSNACGSSPGPAADWLSRPAVSRTALSSGSALSSYARWRWAAVPGRGRCPASSASARIEPGSRAVERNPSSAIRSR